MSIKPSSLTIVAIVLWVVLVPGAGSRQGAKGIVKERMDMMKTMGQSMKLGNAMMTGEAPFDADALKQAARDIEKQSGEYLICKFPVGSLHGPTRSRRKIWRNWSRFRVLAGELQTNARLLEVASGDSDRDVAKTAFKRLSATCKACHRDFRKRKRR